MCLNALLWSQEELLASKTKSQNAVAELEALVTQLGSAAAEEASQAVTAAVDAEKAQHAKALEELEAAKVAQLMSPYTQCPNAGPHGPS